MTKAGDCFVNLCNRLYDIPAAALCVVLFLLQAGVMNYYLMSKLSNDHLSWIAFDVINLGLLVSCIYQSHAAKTCITAQENSAYSFAWASWLGMNIAMAVKTIVIFVKFAVELEEGRSTFFGPNTLKTTIALGSGVFLLLLITQHDAPLGSERKRYIDELTGTVVFDLLDTADILEILFEESKTEDFWIGMKELILAVATLNLVIPTVPLLTLSRTKFGRRKLQRRLIYVHRLSVVLAVNVPNLFVRLNLWHGYNVAISPFTLKNIILICMTVYEFYLHKKEKYQEHEKERVEANNERNTDSIKDTHSENNIQTISNDIGNHVDENFAMEQRIVTYL